MAEDSVKVCLNLPRDVIEKLTRLSNATGFNKTTVIRRAIELEDFFFDVRSRQGKILIKEKGEKGDEFKEVIFR